MANFGEIDGLQQATIDLEKQKYKNRKNGYRFDQLKLLFREDYEVKGITISQPTLEDILKIGEESFYNALSPFLYNTTSIRVMLWDMGIDWCKMKDIEIFPILATNFEDNKDALKVVFKDTDITDFQLVKNNNTDELGLFSQSNNIFLSEEDYLHICSYLREMMNVHPKVEKPKGKTAKRWMIEEDRMKIYQEKSEDSNLFTLVSACEVHPGFKYKTQELRELGIFEFMVLVQRLQIYESSRALLNGSYSGMCDLSKVDRNEFNFMRPLSTENKKNEKIKTK